MERRPYCFFSSVVVLVVLVVLSAGAGVAPGGAIVEVDESAGAGVVAGVDDVSAGAGVGAGADIGAGVVVVVVVVSSFLPQAVMVSARSEATSRVFFIKSFLGEWAGTARNIGRVPHVTVVERVVTRGAIIGHATGTLSPMVRTRASSHA